MNESHLKILTQIKSKIKVGLGECNTNKGLHFIIVSGLLAQGLMRVKDLEWVANGKQIEVKGKIGNMKGNKQVVDYQQIMV